MKENMKLKINEIEIVDFLEEHIHSKVNIINDSKNNKYLHYNLPLEYEKTLNWYKNKDYLNRLDCTVLFEKEVCGFIGLLGIDNVNKKAEFYICIDHNFSGKKIGKNATKLLLKYAFDELKLNKIYLLTEEDNVKAQHLFEKVGFIKEGLIKDDLIHNGRKVNRYEYGIWRENIN